MRNDQSVKAECKELEARSRLVLDTYGTFDISPSDIASLSKRLEYLLDDLEEAKRTLDGLVRVHQVALVRMHHHHEGDASAGTDNRGDVGCACQRCQMARETEDFGVRVDMRQCEHM